MRLLSRFMAWEIHRTLHNFLPCLTFMLFKICNKKNYLFTQITVISVVLRTILRQQTLPFIQNIWETEQNTAHCPVFLTKCIQLSLKFHIFIMLAFWLSIFRPSCLLFFTLESNKGGNQAKVFWQHNSKSQIFNPLSLIRFWSAHRDFSF